MRILRQGATAAMLVALAAVAGCGSGGPAAGGSPPSTTTSMSEVQILALAKEVANCVRSNGLPGFPDPYFENGELKLPPVDDNVKQQGQAALDGPCKDKWQQLEAVLPKANRSQEQHAPIAADDLEKLKQFTQCMREHGLPSFPDPDSTGQYHLGEAGLPPGAGKGNGPADATFRTALDACHQLGVPGMGFTN
jgi:hypothetical protein